jgi:hypothetical protein
VNSASAPNTTLPVVPTQVSKKPRTGPVHGAAISAHAKPITNAPR